MDEPSATDPPIADDQPDEPSLEQLADDLAGVERALERLDDGSYWTDEVTGDALPEEFLAEDPIARRTPPPDDTAP